MGCGDSCANDKCVVKAVAEAAEPAADAEAAEPAEERRLEEGEPESATESKEEAKDGEAKALCQTQAALCIGTSNCDKLGVKGCTLKEGKCTFDGKDVCECKNSSA